MLQYAIRYARIILLAIPAYVLQYEFQCLFFNSGKAEARSLCHRGSRLSIVVAEVAALIVSAVFLLRNRTRYGY